MSGSNPLAPSRTLMRPAPDHPAMLHAKVYQHVSNMAPHEIPDKSSQLETVLPMLGALAGKPNVTPKDVIRAAADAAAKGAVKPSEAVSFISSMPPDPTKLSGWLRNVYESNLSAQIHMKAAMMQQAQQQPAVMPQGGPT